MVYLHQQVVHPASLNLDNQLKVVRLRNEGKSWDYIAANVKNLRKEPTSPQNAQNVYDSFKGKRSVVKKFRHRDSNPGRSGEGRVS